MAAIFLASPVGWVAGGAYTETFPLPFDAERWKAANVSLDTRCAMLADLKYRVRLEGRSRAEVTALLGDADHRFASTTAWELCPSFLDVWILEVRWTAGRVDAAWVRDT